MRQSCGSGAIRSAACRCRRRPLFNAGFGRPSTDSVASTACISSAVILATPVVVWGGWPFLVRGWQSLARRKYNMFTLVGLGVTVAWGYSVTALLAPHLFPAVSHHGGGVPVYFEAAAVITTLVKGDLEGILRARRLSRATLANIRQNLLFAFVYNAAGVPVAAGVLYPFFGVLLSPMLAAAAMSFSSVSVISNALRLRHVKLS